MSKPADSKPLLFVLAGVGVAILILVATANTTPPPSPYPGVSSVHVTGTIKSTSVSIYGTVTDAFARGIPNQLVVVAPVGYATVTDQRGNFEVRFTQTVSLGNYTVISGGVSSAPFTLSTQNQNTVSV